jgi:hypothetical protein
MIWSRHAAAPRGAHGRSVLSAVILAACVAAVGAVAPSEEWAERFRLLEARFEQSEQREAALQKRVAFLEGEAQRLRESREQAEATAPKVWTSTAAVGSMGEPEAVGRRLSAPTCCRWTADDTCGSVPADRFEQCTHLHEYLEGKTTTHEFENLDTCLGADESKWSVKYDGASTNQVTLSNDAAVANLKTPLKVTHAADCGTVPPTLHVQMDTVHDGSLTLGGNTVHSSPTLLFSSGSYPAAESFAAGSWRDFPGLTHTPTLTKTSTLLLVHYQISFGIVGANDASFLACTLVVDGTEQIGARSIEGGGTYGTSSGTWIGAVSAGSPEIKVRCRNSNNIDFIGDPPDDYKAKALIVAILG